MSDFFFDDWINILRTLVNGTLAYVIIVFILRTSGKRTLSKMNMFDLIVTVALGSTLSNIILSKDISLLQGISGFCVLIFLQFIITFTEVRSSKFRKIIKASPTLLYFENEYIDQMLKKERIAKAEIKAAIRQCGLLKASDVHAVILETDGTFSVITQRNFTIDDIKRDGILIH